MGTVRRGTRSVVISGLVAVVALGVSPSAARAAPALVAVTSAVAAPAAPASPGLSASPGLPATAAGDPVTYDGGDLQGGGAHPPARHPVRGGCCEAAAGGPGEHRCAAGDRGRWVPATGVGAVVLNVTGVAPTSSTYLTVWPGGAARPTASSLNLARNQTAPNLVVTKVGRDGIVDLFNGVGSVDVVADLTRAVPRGLGPKPRRSWARVLDTRSAGAPKARGPRRAAPPALELTGRGGLPATGVGAVVVNLTVWPRPGPPT